MAPVWRLKCPIHEEGMVSDKVIPISNDGVINNEPIFFCEKCGCFYIHTDAVLPGVSFDYGKYKVKNTEVSPEEVIDQKSTEVLCTDFIKLKPYTAPFIPDVCYKDQEELAYIKNGIFRQGEFEKEISGYYCRGCHDFYLDEELYDEIEVEVSQMQSKSNGLESNNREKENKLIYSIDVIKPKINNLGTTEVSGVPLSYEEVERDYSKGMPFSLLHYAFIFRRFDIVSKMLEKKTESEIEMILHFRGSDEYSWITPLVCAKWNLNYIESFDDKNNTGISQRLEPYIDEVSHIDEVMEYTDAVDPEGNDIFHIFWNGNQPIMDVVCYERQKLASKQVNNIGYSIVMDEVGTGKTVSALYAIRDCIHHKNIIGEKARILIVCPYNKREDWQSDIRRQLGRYAHIVEQGDNGEMYEGEWKKVYFKALEHLIFITGQKQGNDKNGSYSALKGSLEKYSDDIAWDLAVVDESHISFNSYSGIRAERVMLLTATPIVVNAKGRRNFEDYLSLVNKITGKSTNVLINPITKAEPNENDTYVNWFREDMGKESAERKIRFISCKRWSKREDVYYQIKDEKGTLAALQYDQDDDYLYWAAVEQYGFGNIHEVRKNGKIDRLITLLKENDKSYIVFCEHKFVVDHLFKIIKDEFCDCIVAEKYGNYENQFGLENVQDGQLINTLMQALRAGKRTIFITTGKTGGTGLNLGEFDGVIHYELPFTSIELEQRFGRVDRIDTVHNKKTRDMVFLLNECKPDENDMEVNRMLYYCTTKIDITCQFMPIRNTVLYYPEFIKRNGGAIKESLVCFKKEYILSEQNEEKMKELRRTIRQYEKQIKDSDFWQYIESLGRNLRLSAVEALSNEQDERIPAEYYSYLKEYLDYWQNTKPERNAYQQRYKAFLEAKKNANNWLAIVGLIKLDSNSDVFVGTQSLEDGEEQKINVEDNSMINNPGSRNKSIQKQIDEIIKLIDECVFNDEELKSFSSEGIFCYKDGMIHRSNVKQYREGNAWK